MAKSEKTTEKTENKGFAVVKTGGKQYVVSVGDSISVEKLSDTIKEGDTVTFDNVLLTDDGEKSVIGMPIIKGAKVTGTLEENGRGKKVVVIKYKQKSRYFVKNGHRQPFSKVKINSIS